MFASILGGAVGGALSSAIMSAGVSIGIQSINNGIGNINWSNVGISTLIGAGTGLVFGAIGGAVKYFSSTTKLYRAVSEAEYNSIKSTGKFSSPLGTMEEKWFLTTKNNSLRWANLFYKNGNFKIVKIRVPNSYLSQFYFNANIDGIGLGYAINVDLLNQIVKSIRWVI